MKISEANIQVYRPEQIRNVNANQNARPVQMNKFTQARFAELLSENEKRFISENFSPEPLPDAKRPQLGRFIDVRA